MSQTPKISVVTPSFNCARFLRECIDGVLAQNYPNFEHVIMDGASSDGTVEVLKSYSHLKWTSEKDSGEAEALNKALRLVSGDIIYWLNADDVVLPGVFQQVSDAFKCGHKIVYGKALIIDESGATVGMRFPKSPLDLGTIARWFRHLHLSQPSIFFAREVLDSVGLFREDLFFSIDLEYWLRMAAAGYQYHFVDATFSKARLIRSDAKSAASRAEQEKNWLSVVRPYVLQLGRGAQVDYWKDYYLFLLKERAGSNEQLELQNDPNQYRGLTLALLELGANQEAARIAEAVVQLFPGESDGLWILAEFAAQRGLRAEAQDLTQRALALEQVGKKDQGATFLGPRASPQCLLVFPHNPSPVSSGAHRRIKGFNEALRELGFGVTFFGLEQFSDTPWTPEAARRLEQEFSVRAKFAPRNTDDDLYSQRIGNFSAERGVHWESFAPPGMRRSLKESFEQDSYESIVVTYTYWCQLLDDPVFSGATRLLESQDLVTLNRFRRNHLERGLQQLASDPQYIATITDERFFDLVPTSASPDEFAQCRSADSIVAIAPEEATLFTRGVPGVPVAYIPGGPPVATGLHNTYAGQPLFTVGPNIFNLQGLLYLATRVLPELKRRSPTLECQIVGQKSATFGTLEGCRMLGYVADLRPLYEQAPFALCPLLSGTGMQMKIVEAMAHGVPVIALKNMALNSPIVHGESGFVANNSIEFTDYCAQLLADRSLARRMGQAAREQIAIRFSRDAFATRLSDTLQVARAAKQSRK